jgi:RNA methyltransferase, TrmH family
MKQLSSRHHPLVAAFKAVARGRADAAGAPGEGGRDRMLLDGVHLVTDAVRAGVRLDIVAMTASARASAEGQGLAEAVAAAGAELVEVSGPMMAAMSPVSSPSGVVATAIRPARTIDQVFARAPQLVVVAVDVQEPGNAGAIVRAAEACGATGVAFCGSSADPFGWKALRGSMGSALRLPLAAVPVAAAFAAARRRGVRLAATRPRGGVDPRGADLRGPLAFVMGGEGPGLCDAVLDATDLSLSIPMQAPVESLNVAVAAALLVYEASNQRRVT